jgi:hypothetical protein
VDQLQNALDQLKHGTQPDQEVIRNIRNDVPTAPWLKLKQKRRIEDLDEHLEVDANDKVGSLYNFTRKELGRFFSAAATAPLSDFRGVIGGQSFTPEIYQERFVLNRYYGNQVTEIMGRRQQLLSEVEKANAEIEAHKQDAEARKELFFRRNQASAALNAYDKRAGDELKPLVNGLQKWSSSKNGTRFSYLSALHAIVCRERRAIPETNFVPGTGSIVFYSFQQEVVNQIAERTGGRPVTVELPNLCDGEVEVDGEARIFLVQPYTQVNGQTVERLIFVAQVTKAGEVFTASQELHAGCRNQLTPTCRRPRFEVSCSRKQRERRKKRAMKRIELTLAVLASVVVPAAAQKIASETSDRTRIVHLKTALNHLTVIEVAEPVVQVAAGSPCHPYTGGIPVERYAHVPVLGWLDQLAAWR